MPRLRLVRPITPPSPGFPRCYTLTIIITVYDNSNENAPAYLPPDGASKVNPDQGDYAAVPPPGAPPTRNDDLPAYPAPVAGSSGRQQL